MMTMLAPPTSVPALPDELVKQQKVLVVDDHDSMRRALSELIDLQRDLSVCAAAATAEDAIRALEECRPDAAVVDVSLPGMSGIDLTRLLHARWPDLPVVVISSYPAERFERAALDAGAHAYLVKRKAAVQLIPVLRGGLGSGRRAKFAPDDRPGLDRG